MQLAHFGFHRFPFHKGIPAQDLFRSQEINESLARLLFVSQKASFAVLTGEVGAGKSTLLRLLQAELDPTKFRFCYIADSNLTPYSFLIQALQQLGIEAPFRIAQAKQLFKKAVLDYYENKSITCVFAIDEVQSMDYSMLGELVFLSNYNVDSFSPLAFILAGQKEMITRLKTLALAPLRRRIDSFFQLEAMSKDDTIKYIEHHLQVAGCQRPIFPEDILEKIYEYSKGIPALINRICVNCLFAATTERKKLVDSASFNRSIAEIF